MVDLLVEGVTDEIFVRCCYRKLGIPVGTVFGRKGVDFVVRSANGLAQRGRYSPILILADLMDLGECPSSASGRLVRDTQALALVSLAVNEIESWLLASRKELASYLGVSLSKIPSEPDRIADPKQVFVNLARNSRRTVLREMIVPKVGISATVGAGYVDAFSQFMNFNWSLDAARGCSPSFNRFVARSLERFVQH